MAKKHLVSFFFGLVFLAGVGIVSYPSISDWNNQRHASRAVAEYQDQVQQINEEDYTEIWNAAREHNEQICQAGSLSAALRMENADQQETYRNLLSISYNQVMGVLRIPKIDLSMPIYHTTEDAVIQIAAGHYVGSSLPVGGEGTHCILSGHRGLPSARLFTDLDQMVEGDLFYLDVLGETLAYQVDNIQIVLPEKVESLNVDPQRDLVTLVTCTPYGINTHRLLVRGTRVPYIPEKETKEKPALVLPVQREKELPKLLLFAGGAFGIAIALGSICGSISRKKAGKRAREEKAIEEKAIEPTTTEKTRRRAEE